RGQPSLRSRVERFGVRSERAVRERSDHEHLSLPASGGRAYDREPHRLRGVVGRKRQAFGYRFNDVVDGHVSLLPVSGSSPLLDEAAPRGRDGDRWLYAWLSGYGYSPQGSPSRCHTANSSVHTTNSTTT